mmetsp:Transcript_13176/g.44648  ORF Transcript_13176/g.44648 Transcript_13176/m.44648 type:complete len:284 (+) Transcript_13176:487-1338(+)
MGERASRCGSAGADRRALLGARIPHHGPGVRRVLLIRMRGPRPRDPHRAVLAHFKAKVLVDAAIPLARGLEAAHGARVVHDREDGVEGAASDAAPLGLGHDRVRADVPLGGTGLAGRLALELAVQAVEGLGEGTHAHGRGPHVVVRRVLVLRGRGAHLDGRAAHGRAERGPPGGGVERPQSALRDEVGDAEQAARLRVPHAEDDAVRYGDVVVPAHVVLHEGHAAGIVKAPAQRGPKNPVVGRLGRRVMRAAEGPGEHVGGLLRVVLSKADHHVAFRVRVILR